MGFLQKVEAKTSRLVHKPTKPVKFGKTAKEQESTAEKQKKPSQANFMRLKQLLPEFEKMLTLANPFILNDITWARFFALAAPKVMATLLWDLGHIDRAQRTNMIRYFKQRVKLP